MSSTLEADVHQQKRGIGLALTAAALFGVSAPLAKGLLTLAGPQLLAGLLYLGSGGGLAAVRLIRRGRPDEAPLRRTDAPWLAGAIVTGGVVAPFLLMWGLARTPASSASLLLNLEGVFTAALAWVVFHENVDRKIALGMLAIVAGGVLLAWQGPVGLVRSVGPLAIAGACGCWAVDNNLTQKVSAGDPVQIAMLKGLAAGSVNLLLALFRPSATLGGTFLIPALLLGFLSYGVSLVLYVRALRDLGTARTGAYFSLAPFVGALTGVLLWHEAVTVPLISAALLMGFGLWLHLSERHEHEHRHEAMEHEHLHVHDTHHQHAHTPSDPAGEPHSHRHRHEPLVHGHVHYPDIHHRHGHS